MRFPDPAMTKPPYRDSRPTNRGTIIFAAIALLLVASGLGYVMMAPRSAQNHPPAAGLNDTPSNLPVAPAQR
jgi:hypothetical protein